MKTLIALLMALSIPAWGAPHNSRCFIDNVINGTATTNSTLFLVASANRSCLFIQNGHVSNPVYINTVASTSATSTYRLGGYETFSPSIVPSNDIYIHVSTSSAPVKIFSGVAIP